MNPFVSALQEATKELQASGRLREGVSFNCIVNAVIDRNYKRYFIDKVDDNGTVIGRTVAIPQDGVVPEGAIERPVLQVVVSPLNEKGEADGGDISAFILESSLRNPAPELSPVGMVARATVIKTPHKYGAHAGEAAYFLSGLTILEANAAVQTYRAAKVGGLAMSTK